MKGKLVKTEQGWMVGTVCYADIWSNHIPLHPNDVKQINADAQVFDNIEARIAAYSDVEFEIVGYWEKNTHRNAPTKDDLVNYAKLIHHSIDTNEMVEDDVEKLVKEHWENDKELNNPSSFKAGYDKAKSSLYTQEDIDNLLSMYTDDAPVSYVKRDYKKYLQSLKQPK